MARHAVPARPSSSLRRRREALSARSTRANTPIVPLRPNSPTEPSPAITSRPASAAAPPAQLHRRRESRTTAAAFPQARRAPARCAHRSLLHAEDKRSAPPSDTLAHARHRVCAGVIQREHAVFRMTNDDFPLAQFAGAHAPHGNFFDREGWLENRFRHATTLPAMRVPHRSPGSWQVVVYHARDH